MQNQDRPLARAFWLILLFLVGCSPVIPSPSPTTTIQPLIPSPTKIIPSTMPTPQPTLTPVPPTITTRPSPVPPTPIHITATTRSPLPTLPSQSASLQMENLIRNQGTCHLPCWFGIAPGKSTTDDFFTFFKPFSSVLTFLNGGVDFESGQEIKSYFHITYRTRANQNVIDSLDITTRALKKVEDGYEEAYTSESYHQLFLDFSLSQILTIYGFPSKVLVSIHLYLYDGNPALPSQQFGTLKLRLVYSDLGVMVIYEMPMSKVGEYGKACPSDAFVSFWLTPPDPDGYYERLLSSLEHQGEAFDYDKTTDEALTMSLEEFYETFRKPSQKCVQTKLSIWPPQY